MRSVLLLAAAAVVVPLVVSSCSSQSSVPGSAGSVPASSVFVEPSQSVREYPRMTPLLTGQQVADIGLLGLVPESVSLNLSEGMALMDMSSSSSQLLYSASVWESVSYETDPCAGEEAGSYRPVGDGCLIWSTSKNDKYDYQTTSVRFRLIPKPGVQVVGAMSVDELYYRPTPPAGTGLALASQDVLASRAQALAQAQADLLARSGGQ